MTDSVIIRLQGGLGNQLFQYAAGLSIAKETGGELWLNTAELNKHTNQDYIKRYYTRSKAIGIDGKPNKTSSVIRQKNAFEKWNPSSYKDKDVITLLGYYQYLPAIKSEVEVICKDIIEHLSDTRSRLREKYSIQDAKQFCFLHIRRGDYLNHPNIHHLQDEIYYKNGINYINGQLKKNIQWIVLSDDIKWCKNQEWLQSDIFTIVNEPNELDGLMLMSLCEGGAIIANSTYSWWGANLGCVQVNAPVVYPLKWIRNDKPDLFLDNWKGF